jgi:hypothetical protein
MKNRYSFPFLSEDITQVTNQAVRPLYEQCIHAQFPNLFFIGLPFSVVPFPLMDVQALLCANLLTGKAQLPSQMELWKQDQTITRSIEAGQGVPKNWHKLADEQWEYTRRLLVLAVELTPEREQRMEWRRWVFTALGRERGGTYPGAVDSYRSLNLAELEHMAKDTDMFSSKPNNSACL